MPLLRATRRTRTAAVLVVLGGLTACGLLTPREAVDAAEAQWASVPQAARDALQLTGQDAQAEGSVADHWAIRADTALAPGDVDDVLGSGVVAACTAVAQALDGTGVQAFGVLPLTLGLVAADPVTCARGLTLGSWRTTTRDEDVRDDQGRPLAPGQLELGRSADGRAQLLGVALDLTTGVLRTSSDTPPWTAPATEVTAADVDAAILGAGRPLPLELPGDDVVPDVLVVAVPAGTALQATVTCRAPLGGIGVESPSSTYGLTAAVVVEYGTVADDALAACDAGPAVVDLVPSLRWTPEGGEPTDVVVLETARLADGPTSLVVDRG